MSRSSLILMAMGLVAAGGGLLAPASLRAEIRPFAGLVMLTAGCLLLARPLAGPLARFATWAPVGAMRLAGIGLLVSAIGCVLVLGPAGRVAAVPLVLALLGVSLVALGSTPVPARGLGVGTGLVDSPDTEQGVSQHANPSRARAA